jgi:NitT/TauT family transport system substrate-binding protein
MGSKLFTSRRLVLLVAAGMALAAAGCGGAANSGAGAGKAGGKSMTIGLQLDWDNLPAFVALEQGFLKAHGISDVKYVKFTALPAMMTAVSQGQVDAALQTPPVMHKFNEASSGPKLKFFAPGLQSIQLWSARTGSGVPSAANGDWQSTVKAWKGKKIGVPARGGLTEYLTNYMARQVGLNPDTDLTYVAIGLGPSELAALKTGAADIDAGVPYGATLISGAQAGYPVLNLLRGEGPAVLHKLANTNYLASEKRIKENRELFAGFAAALTDARKFLKDPANRAKVEQIIQKHVNVDAARAKVLYEWIDSYDSELTRDTVDRTARAGAEAGMLPSPPPSYSDLVFDVQGS